ncbi:MAG: hypothetical protein HYT94_04400 [Parcubacteria group bacterium]|nr:hypothetical protein [Parcubacteria group bacterium]
MTTNPPQRHSKSSELLISIQLGAKKAGLDTMADDELVTEVVSYRKEKAMTKIVFDTEVENGTI